MLYQQAGDKGVAMTPEERLQAIASIYETYSRGDKGLWITDHMGYELTAVMTDLDRYEGYADRVCLATLRRIESRLFALGALLQPYLPSNDRFRPEDETTSFAKGDTIEQNAQ